MRTQSQVSISASHYHQTRQRTQPAAKEHYINYKIKYPKGRKTKA